MTSKPPENFRFPVHRIVNEVRYSLTLNMLKIDSFLARISKPAKNCVHAAEWVRGMLGCYRLNRGIAGERALNARRDEFHAEHNPGVAKIKSKCSKSTLKRTVLLEQLEQRYLFSADLAIPTDLLSGKVDVFEVEATVVELIRLAKSNESIAGVVAPVLKSNIASVVSDNAEPYDPASVLLDYDVNDSNLATELTLESYSEVVATAHSNVPSGLADLTRDAASDFIASAAKTANPAGVDSSIDVDRRQITTFSTDNEVANTVPTAANSTENTSFVFEGANVIVIEDGLVADESVKVSLAVANGTLTLANSTGITIVDGADGSGNMVVEGLESDVNAALNGLIFTPDPDFSGADTLLISTDSPGGALTTSGSTAVNTTPANNPPELSSTAHEAVVAYDFENGTASTVAGAPPITVDAPVEISSVDGFTMGSNGLLFPRGDNRSGNNNPVSISGIPGVAANNEFSFSAQVRFDEGDGNRKWERIFDFAGGQANNNLILTRFITSDDLVLESFSGSNLVAQIYIPNALEGIEGEWHHYGVSADSTGIVSLFIDGVLVGSQQLSSLPNYSAWDEHYLGSSNWNGNKQFQGAMDDIAIFDRAVDAVEMAALAQNFELPENSANGTLATIAYGRDIDGDELTYSIPSQEHPGAFAIDAKTGEITVADSGQLNFESDNTHDVTVRVSDEGKLFDEDIYKITLTDVAEIQQTVPGAQNVDEDDLLTFSDVDGNAVTVSDGLAIGDELLHVQLAVTDGVLDLSGLSGITIVAGANGSSTMTIVGTDTDINNALDGMTFEPDADFNGNVMLDVTTALLPGGDLAGSYTFDNGVVIDQAFGVPQNGELKGNATTVIDPVRGEVLSLSKGGDAVEIDGLFGEPENVTLSAWVNLTSVTGVGAEVISLGNNIQLRADGQDSDNGLGISLVVRSGNTWHTIDSDEYIEGTGWNHIAATFDDTNNTQTIYLNGSAIASSSTGLSISYNRANTTVIGDHGERFGNYDFTGLIDDARVYTRALTAAEIAELASPAGELASATSFQGSVTDSVPITVDPVNDDPVLEGSLPVSVSVTEDLLSDIDILPVALDDIDAETGNLTIELSTSTGGRLILAPDSSLAFGARSSAVIISGTLTNLQSYLNTPSVIQYVHPVADTSGIGADTITIKVNDNGNTGTGGGADVLLGVIDVDITDVNDEPVAIVASSVADEDAATVEVVLSGTDPDGMVTHIRVDSLPSNGTLYTDATRTTVIQVNDTLVAGANTRSVYFQPDVNWNGVTSFEFSSRDNDGAFSVASTTATITINPLNDAPFLTSIEALPVFFVENSTPVGITGNLQLSDIDNTHIDSAIVAITNNHVVAEDTLIFTDQSGISGSYDASSGILTLSGNASIEDYQAALHSVAYSNSSSNPTTSTRTVSFEINDGDLSGNVLSRDIDFVTVNDAPTLSATETTAVAYTENTAPVAITSSTLISDVDDTHIESATVSISGNFAANEDQLHFTDQSGITGSYDSVSGVLLLSGSATLSDYETAIASVTFDSNSDDPSVVTRTISITVNDGNLVSNTVFRNIAVAAVNDSPTLSNIEIQAASYIEDSSATGITGNLSVADVDDTVIESATVSISNNHEATEDVLLFTDQSGITGTFNSSTGILTLSGTASVVDYEAALRTVAYSNSSNNPNTSTRTVSFQINDGSADSDSLSRDITIAPVNDAPLALGETISVDEDQVYVGTGLTSLLANDTDPDGDTLFTNTTPVVSPGNGTVSIQSDGSFIYTPNTNFTGIDSFSYEVSDANDSTDVASVTININPINDAPNTSMVSLGAIPEDSTTIVISEADLLVNASDIDDDVLAINGLSISSGNATLVNNGDGTWTVTPVANTLVDIELQYSVTDGIASAPGSAVIAIASVNDSPIASGESISLSEDSIFNSSASNNLLVNDTDIDGDSLEVNITPVKAPASGTVTINSNGSFTYIPHIDFHGTDSFTYQINDGNGGSDEATVTIAVLPVNDAPVLADIEILPANYSEGSTPVSLSDSLTLTDIDHVNIDSATIVISSNFVAGEDELIFTDQSGITGSYDTTTGVLSLHGSATVNEYQSAIRSVEYLNTSNNPVNLTRTVSVETHDGTDPGNPLERDIQIFPANDAPVITGSDSEVLLYQENASPIPLLTDLTITDPDSPVIQSATIVIADNFNAAEDLLLFNDTSGISGIFDPLSGTLTLSGTSSLADYEAAMRSISYVNTSDNPGTTPRKLDIVVSDGSNNSNTIVRTIEPQPVNDAPTASGSTVELLEDSQVTLIADDFGFEDVSDGHAFTGIVVRSVPTSGTLILDGQPVANEQFIQLDDITAGLLLFIPEPDKNGEDYAQLEFLVVDDGGVALNGVNTSINTAFVSFDVTSVNDEPNGRDNNIVIAEDTTYVFSREDFGFSDEQDNDSFAAITISALPEQGSLTLDSNSLQADALVDIELIDSGLLRYTPEPDFNGLGFPGFSFRVHDDGDSNNHGPAVDQTENIISFDIPAINDSPLLITNETTVDEGSENILNTDQVNAIDPDNSPEELVFAVNSLPMNGDLNINGIPAVAGATFTLAQLLQDQVIYTHDGSETSTDFFEVEVSDGSNNISELTSGRFSFVINEVIDPAPVVSDESLTLEFGGNFDSRQGNTLDSGEVTLASNLISDNSNLMVTIETPPESGALELNPDGTFIYVHDGSSVLQDSFEYRVTNEDGISAVANVTIDIEPAIQSALEAALIQEQIAADNFIFETIEVVQRTTIVDTETTDSSEQTQSTEDEKQEEPASQASQAEDSEASNSNQLDLNATNSTSTLLINTDTPVNETDLPSIRQIQGFEFSRDDTTADVAGLGKLKVVQHNRVIFNQLSHVSEAALSKSVFNILTEINTASKNNVVSAPRFADALKLLDNDFDEFENSSEVRAKFTADGTIGASLGATAGILAWMLRGGAVFASVMASTPIWSSIDPLRVTSKSGTDKPSEGEEEVEDIFS